MSAKQLTQLGTDLMQDASKSDAATEGDLENIKNVPKQTSGKATKLGGAGYLAVGCLLKFGHQAEQFDSKVENLNTQVRQSTFGPMHDPDVRSGKVDIDLNAIRKACEDRLRPTYNDYVDKLDRQAESVAGMLKAGPDDTDNIRKLIRQGFLPLSAAAAFPDLKLTQQDKAVALKSRMKDKSPKELREFLSKHPEYRGATKHLLDKENLTKQDRAIIDAQAKVDARAFKDAVNSDNPSEQTLERIANAQQLLKHINGDLADGGQITEARHAFMTTWLNGAGAAALAKLPSVARQSAATMSPTERISHGFANGWRNAKVAEHLRPVANSILNLSNANKYAPGAGNIHRGDRPMDEPKVSKFEMPQAVQDLMDLRIGEKEDGYRVGSANGDEPGRFDTIKNLDKFNGWADLMNSASKNVEGGSQFSADLAHQAIQAKQDMNSILASANGQNGEATEEWDPDRGEMPPDLVDLEKLKSTLNDQGSSQLLSVVSHNEDASSNLILNETDRHALLGMNWQDSDGATDIIGAATDRDPEHGGGSELQSKAAWELIKDVGENRSEYLGGRYDSEGDEDIDQEDLIAKTRMTEGVSDAVVDVGITWIDQFGDAHNTSFTGGAGEDGFELNPGTESNFLRFVSGTGDSDAVRFHTAANLQSQHDLTEAFKSQDQGRIMAALDHAGRLEGRIVGADMEHQVDIAAAKDAGENQAADEQYSAKQRQMAAGKVATKVVLGGLTAPISPTGAAATVLLSGSQTAADGFVDELWDAGGPPEDTHKNETKVTADWRETAASDAQTYQRRMVVQSALDAGVLTPEDMPPGTTEDVGGDPKIAKGADAEALSQPFFATPVDQGTYESGWDSGFNGRDQHRTGGSGGWLNDNTARNYLYGDDAENWDDEREWERIDRYSGPIYPDNPYNADPSKNDDNKSPYQKFGG